MNNLEISVQVRYQARRPGTALCGSASVVFNKCFIVRGLKILSLNGGMQVKMPNFKLRAPCPGCKKPCALTYRYCPSCGREFSESRIPVDSEGRPKLHRDVAHPLNSEFGDYLSKAVIAEYFAGLQRIANFGIRSAEISVQDDDDGGPWDEPSYIDWDIHQADHQSLGLLMGESMP